MFAKRMIWKYNIMIEKMFKKVLWLRQTLQHLLKLMKNSKNIGKKEIVEIEKENILEKTQDFKEISEDEKDPIVIEESETINDKEISKPFL